MRMSCLSRFPLRFRLIGPDWLLNVFDLLNAKVHEAYRQDLAYLIVCRAGDTNASWLGDGL
jgi:hypothetical protein